MSERLGAAGRAFRKSSADAAHHPLQLPSGIVVDLLRSLRCMHARIHTAQLTPARRELHCVAGSTYGAAGAITSRTHAVGHAGAPGRGCGLSREPLSIDQGKAASSFVWAFEMVCTPCWTHRYRTRRIGRHWKWSTSSTPGSCRGRRFCLNAT